jgi:hypothetical protein
MAVTLHAGARSEHLQLFLPFSEHVASLVVVVIEIGLFIPISKEINRKSTVKVILPHL